MGRVYRNILIAWILLGIAFQMDVYFWILFPIVQGILLLYSIWKGKPSANFPSVKQLAFATISGVFIYGLFAIGKVMIVWIVPSLFENLNELYGLIQPKTGWHTVLVFLLIIPAEEWFWRGYVQTHLEGSAAYRISVSVSLYALAHLASGSILLVLAALVAGLIWALLYEYTKTILVPLISHLAFDLLLFVVFPLL